MNINDIEAIFGTAGYPENGFPGEQRPSEWEYVYDRLRGKDWRDLRIEDFDAQSGIDEGISCLSADTFVYFLPGLMNLALNDTSTGSARYCIAYGIATRLTRSDSDHQYQSKAHGHKQRREQKRLGREYECLLQEASADEKLTFALLSARQRQLVAQFLRDALQQEPMLCLVVVNSAIHNLEQGKIEPYRQADVSQWVAQYKSTRRHIQNES